MEVLYILLPVSALLVIAIVAAFLWAIRSGQFDDLEGPAYRILMDEDEKLTIEKQKGQREKIDK